MSNKIKKTAICHWSQDDNCFVVHSHLQPFCIGEGDTPEAAWKEFENLIAEATLAKEGVNTAQQLSGVELREFVGNSVYRDLNELAAELGVDRGTAIHYLLEFFKVAVLPNKPGQPPINPHKSLAR
jgi:hypothetical protein